MLTVRGKVSRTFRCDGLANRRQWAECPAIPDAGTLGD